VKTKDGTEIPEDLATALRAEAGLESMWGRLRPSCQERHVSAVLEAKRPETRRRRIAAVVRATVDWNRRHPARPATPAVSAASRARLVLDELRSMGSEENRAGMARYGINVGNAFGISVYDLRAMAQRLGTDHALAGALWATGNHEARLLACFVDDPDLVEEPQLEEWARGFDSWDLCDQATTSLFDRSRHAWRKAVEWTERDDEWVKRAGYTLMAGLAAHDEAAGDRAFEELLPLVERGAFDPRNFVKKAVNWALRNIGKRNLALNAAAVSCAERIRAEADRRAGGSRGGAPGDRAARWVAADALRELQSEKVRARLSAAARRSH